MVKAGPKKGDKTLAQGYEKYIAGGLWAVCLRRRGKVTPRKLRLSTMDIVELLYQNPGRLIWMALFRMNTCLLLASYYRLACSTWLGIL
jgi:hypothetical protein